MSNFILVPQDLDENGNIKREERAFVSKEAKARVDESMEKYRLVEEKYLYTRDKTIQDMLKLVKIYTDILSEIKNTNEIFSDMKVNNKKIIYIDYISVKERTERILKKHSSNNYREEVQGIFKEIEKNIKTSTGYSCMGINSFNAFKSRMPMEQIKAKAKELKLVDRFVGEQNTNILLLRKLHKEIEAIDDDCNTLIDEAKEIFDEYRCMCRELNNVLKKDVRHSGLEFEEKYILKKILILSELLLDLQEIGLCYTDGNTLYNQSLQVNTLIEKIRYTRSKLS